MPSKLKYYSTAAVLGIGWFLVLLIPVMPRGWLLHEGLAPYNLAFLVISSVLVSFIFRHAISTAKTIGKHVACGCLIPYVGCIVYLTINYVFLRARGFFGREWPDPFVLYVFGLFLAVRSFFVVLPFGILSQYVMNRISAEKDDLKKV